MRRTSSSAFVSTASEPARSPRACCTAKYASATASVESFTDDWTAACRARSSCRAASGAYTASENANTTFGPNPAMNVLRFDCGRSPAKFCCFPVWAK